MDDFPLIDTLDHEIIMHRDAHFGGSFPAMHVYYEDEAKGAVGDFELVRIKELETLEKHMGKNLTEELVDFEKQEVKKAKDTYLALRSLYESKNTSDIPVLIADLILAEEEQPEKEMDALVAKGSEAVPSLIDLLASDDFYNPLFPGYGQAPSLAAICLGRIKDERAVIPLFEQMKRKDFFTEEAILEALHKIGEPARKFLLKKLKSTPITQDNESAAIALLLFGDDEEIAKASLEVLQKKPLSPTFAAYLILGCYSLKDKADQEKFEELSKTLPLSPDLKEEMENVINNWNIDF